MINSKYLLEFLTGLLAEDFDKLFILGYGIITEQQVAFDEEVLEKNKAKVARILKELGINELPSITLERLTKLKDGEKWNELQNKEEFEALDLLLACSDACGFIVNNILTVQRNEFELGNVSSILTSDFGERLRNGINDEWLRMVREEVIGKMSFSTNVDKIN
ncbi:MAG: hypothetical protein K2G03_06905 [Bacilli bacterium]|nr:hypothetical protein [Bacilli bacterium]